MIVTTILFRALFGFALVFGSLFLLVACSIVIPKISQGIRLVFQVVRIFKRKNTFPDIKHEVVDPWPQPITRQEFLDSDKCEIEKATKSEVSTSSSSTSQTGAQDPSKVIWGYWHQGIESESFPGVCSLALQSWKLRHPGWKIIILSEANYKDYVSPSDIPSTFNSLKIQFRSDIIRASVLRRYGGVYLDTSYFLMKSLDAIWDEAKRNNDIYLTSLWTLKSQGRDFVVPNICLIVAPQPNNPLLTAWHKALLEFFENPSFTVPEMKKHPNLSRVSAFMDHASLWTMKHISPYFVSLWTLMDTIYYNEEVASYVQDHVYILPPLLWTVGELMSGVFSMPKEDVYTKDHDKLSLWTWIMRLPYVIKLHFCDDAQAANKFCSVVNAVKASTDFDPDFHREPEFHLGLQTTQGHIWRKAIDPKTPRQQATATGSYRLTPVASVADDESSTTSIEPDPVKPVPVLTKLVLSSKVTSDMDSSLCHLELTERTEDSTQNSSCSSSGTLDLESGIEHEVWTGKDGHPISIITC